MFVMKRWQFWVGVLISIAFLWLVLRGLSIAEFLAVLPGIKFWWLIPGVVVYFIGVWVRTWRWHYLLRPIKSVSISKLFPVVCIGYAGNNIFPARAGELLRAVVLKRNEEIPVSSSLATIIVERVFDGVVMLAFVFLNLRELTGHTGSSGFVGNIQTLALVGTAAFIGALTLFLLAAMFPDKAQTAAELFSRWFIPARFRGKVLGFTERFLGGLEALRSPKDVLMVFVTSVIVWLLETAKYWFVMHAFPFEVSFFALMLMNGIVNLATTIPSAPGYVGTFDAPGIAVLQSYGVEKAVAVAYTLVLHAALWFPITALGLYYMAREGISWGQDMDQLRAEA
ncbi:MAG: lysylphosphatidylglycerol synthase transmembrane domain-containing protein [Chloroflexota bacterium]|nr:lysylphosphatidylglycerol synthase transmembrane domain-containing protein [Chloroflexota bacterium]